MEPQAPRPVALSTTPIFDQLIAAYPLAAEALAESERYRRLIGLASAQIDDPDC